MFEFKLPDVGEGLTEADVLEWHVAVGDVVEVDQTLVEIETAKSVVELPSPVAGRVEALRVAVGDTVPVGTVIIAIADGSATEAAPAPAPPPVVEPVVEPVEAKPLVLVGTGPAPMAARTRHLRREASGSGVRAAPPTRLLARRLGVDLGAVHPADGDVVTAADVEQAARALAPSAPVPATAGTTSAGPREVRTPVTGVRKATAAAMTASAFTAPHVTEFLAVDVTRTMELLARLKADRAWSGVRLTPLVLVAKALLLAVRHHPGVNARWDEEAQEIVEPTYVNLGIAAATPRGLIVPNVKDADRLDLRALAGAVEELVTTARSGRTAPAAMAGGTITITNIGALGVDAGTPILNPGEAAILAFGNVRDMPWVVDGEIRVRKVTQLALSFDHRLVDGELGSRVLTTLGRILTDPGEALVLV